MHQLVQSIGDVVILFAYIIGICAALAMFTPKGANKAMKFLNRGV